MNPLRSEADAFRLLLIIGAGALTVILVALVLGSLPGFIWGLFLIGVGVGRIVRSRGGEASATEIAVVVDDVPGDELVAELTEIEEEPAFVVAMVVAPGSGASDRERARQRMEISLQLLQEAGLRARGQVLEVAPEDLGGGPVTGLDADRVIISLRRAA